MSITENVKRVYENIGEAASRAGRDPSEITLVAVTKTRTIEEIEEAADSGIVHFGENRLQEASLKIPAVKRQVIWHMVGPLQSNKGKRAVSIFDWIDSIHSRKIADVLSARACDASRTLKVLVQINISGEDVKSGVSPDDVRELVAYTMRQDGLDVKGLMAIGSFGVTLDVTRTEFVRMREIFERLREDPTIGSGMEVLSMGMSGDYELAVEEGATMVRIGTAIFGTRN